MSGTIHRVFSSSQNPGSSVARVASSRASSRSFASSRNTLTPRATNFRSSVLIDRACTIATPFGSSSRSDCRSQSCPPVSADDPVSVRRYVLSSVSARASIADASGLTAPVATAPSRIAHISGADRKCHADTPAARATISSLDRVSRQNAMMPPSSTANGRICIATYGSRNAAISSTSPNVASGLVADRRSSSMKSNSATTPDSDASIASTARTKLRAI